MEGDVVPEPLTVADLQTDQPVAQGRRHRTDSMDDEVSDIASVGSINSDDVDDLLSNGEEDLDDLDGKDNEIILANRQCNVSTDAILAREFAVEEPRPSLPAVSEKLALAVTSWMRNTPKREKIREMFREVLVPENVEGLLPVRINEILYQRLPFKARVNDQRLRGINTYFARGIAPLVSVLDEVVKLESVLTGDAATWKSSQGRLEKGDLQFDVSKLCKLMSQAVKILSAGHAVLLTKRRGLLRPYLDNKFHFLLKPTNPRDPGTPRTRFRAKNFRWHSGCGCWEETFPGPQTETIYSEKEARSRPSQCQGDPTSGTRGTLQPGTDRPQRRGWNRYQPYSTTKNSRKTSTQNSRGNLGTRGRRGSRGHGNGNRFDSRY